MQTTNLAALLQAAPEAHSRRCALAHSAIDAKRWPAAICGLRSAATLAEEWAQQVRALADWCDAQAEYSRGLPASPSNGDTEAQVAALLPVDQPTAESLEAGLMALAHALGRDHALRARRAMNGVLSSQQHSTSAPEGAAA